MVPHTDPDLLQFLRVLRQSPHDDTTRLVFADWLADRDDVRAGRVREFDGVEVLSIFAATPVHNLRGRTLGHLLPVTYIGDGVWFCLCLCGLVTTAKGRALRMGTVRRCTECR